MTEETVLLFDLGGVLIDNATFDDLPRLLPAPIDRADLYDRWLASEAVRRFERGEIGPAEFGAAFVEEWGLAVDTESFLARFITWPSKPTAAALELLDQLRERYRIAILSNCNVLHWDRLATLRARADLAVSSHLCGMVKPDAEVFDHVIRDLGCAPGAVVFFDDSLKNVEAARRAGMTAHHTVGFDALRRQLSELGYLATQPA